MPVLAARIVLCEFAWFCSVRCRTVGGTLTFCVNRNPDPYVFLTAVALQAQHLGVCTTCLAGSSPGRPESLRATRIHTFNAHFASGVRYGILYSYVFVLAVNQIEPYRFMSTRHLFFCWLIKLQDKRSSCILKLWQSKPIVNCRYSINLPRRKSLDSASG